MSIPKILEELGATSKSTEKLVILKNLIGTEDEELFKKVAVAALDGRINYWLKDFPVAEQNSGSLTLEQAVDKLSKLSSRELTGNAAKDFLLDTIESLSDENEDVIARIIKRDLGCGASTKTLNKVWPDLIYEHPYMRCSSYSAKNLQHISFPAFSQTKADGSYTDIFVDSVLGTVEYRSRSGELKNYGNPEKDQELLDLAAHVSFDKFVLMGEALVEVDGRVMTREAGNGILNSDDVGEAQVIFHLWDLVNYDEWKAWKGTVRYFNRFAHLQQMFALHESKFFSITETKVVNTVEEVIEHFQSNIEAGLEGTVLKDYEGLWAYTTSKHQVKVKVVFEVDLKITGWKEGTGKHKGKLGAFTFATSDDLLEVSVGGGYTDKQREDFWAEKENMLGTIGTVRANNITKNQNDEMLWSLFLPRFIEIRTDKTEADSFERVKEQLGSSKDILELISKE